MKKRVLVFITDYMTVMGGSQIALREVMRELSSDHTFDVITARFSFSNKRLDILDDATIYRVGFGFSFDRFLLPFFGWWKGIQLTRKHHYSLVWASQVSYGGLAACFFTRGFFKSILFRFFPSNNNRLPLFVSIQEDSIDRLEYGRGGLIRYCARMIMSGADHIHVISHYLKHYVEKKSILCPVSVIPNGVDIDLFSTSFSREEIELLRSRLSITPSDFVIITTSRLVEKNRVEDIIRSCVFLDYSWKCIVIGTGDQEFFLRKLAHDLEIGERVIFVGHVAHRDIPRYLACADVFVRPSLTEGLGNSFLESMAAGVPVVGTSVGGIVDFLRDGETGLVCLVKNPFDLSLKIMRLRNNVDLRNGIIARSRALVAESYSWHNVARSIDIAFSSLITPVSKS